MISETGDEHVRGAVAQRVGDVQHGSLVDLLFPVRSLLRCQREALREYRACFEPLLDRIAPRVSIVGDFRQFARQRRADEGELSAALRKVGIEAGGGSM
jgi:hypothetical protein